MENLFDLLLEIRRVPIQDLDHPCVFFNQICTKPAFRMKLSIAISLLLFVLVSSKTRTRGPEVTVVRSEFENEGEGNFNWSFETTDGTKQNQRGYINKNKVRAVTGGFSYTSSDGKPFSLTYSADEFGYHPISDSLPTPPPIPIAIQRALYILYANAQKQIAAKKAQQNRSNTL